MASSDRLAVEVHGLGKRYRLGQLQAGYSLLTEAVSDRVRQLGKPEPKREEFWALRDIGFEVPQGERFGIIGHNGAGKSTLLKLLARVTPPTEGSIRMRGRVGALLEVGTGFSPELTGRENVYLNGAILGMRRREIDAKFDQIVEFADVQRFVDTPVKRYSSGMYLRLAFSVAAHLEPEVLIVDEVLSVGDLAFQRKCIGRMQEVTGEGRTVLFVSHNLSAVSKLCSRSMLLAHGHKVTEGPTEAVINRYIETVTSAAATELAERSDRTGSGRLRLSQLEIDAGTEGRTAAVTGQELVLRLAYEARAGAMLRDAVFAVSFYSARGAVLLQCQSKLAGAEFGELPRQGEVRLRIPRLPLTAGRYRLNTYVEVSGEIADWVQDAAELHVTEGDYYGSGHPPSESYETVLIDQDWSLSEVSDGAATVAADDGRSTVST
jgi:lipopolysaccharide transport system ATP-binding protein